MSPFDFIILFLVAVNFVGLIVCIVITVTASRITGQALTTTNKSMQTILEKLGVAND